MATAGSVHVHNQTLHVGGLLAGESEEKDLLKELRELGRLVSDEPQVRMLKSQQEKELKEKLKTFGTVLAVTVRIRFEPKIPLTGGLIARGLKLAWNLNAPKVLARLEQAA